MIVIIKFEGSISILMIHLFAGILDGHGIFFFLAVPRDMHTFNILLLCP
jgi:hypothetical protein